MITSEQLDQDLPGQGRLWAAIARELRWSLRGRPTWLLGIGFNSVVAALYLAYYRSAANLPNRSLSYLGASLAAWILADAITTNQFGAEADRVAATVKGRVGFGRVLLVKNASLAVLLLALTLPISIAATAWTGRWSQLGYAALVDLHVVLVWIGLGNIVSVLLPYRPIRLKERWRLPRTWIRWVICLLIPYALYLIIGWLSIPVRVMAHGTRSTHPAQYAILSAAWGVGYWIIGTLLAERLAHGRKARLVRALQRPN